MKQCSRCKKWKDESEFSKKSSRKDGLKYWCKKCEREYARSHYHRTRQSSQKYRRYEQCHRVVDGVKVKRCSRCKKWKAESEFYKRRKHKDGLAVWCKECADKATNKCRRRRSAVRQLKRAGMKRCSRCKKWKDESEFGKKSTHKDGLRSSCKKCERDYSREYQRRQQRHLKTCRRHEESHRVVDGVKQKQCNKCDQWKPEDEFHKRRKSKDGLQWRCKECINEAGRNYRRKRLAVRN